MSTASIGRPQIDPRPDFGRFRQTLLLEQAFKRPPLFDFIIDQTHLEAVLGRPVRDGGDMVEAYCLAGFDYVQLMSYCPMDELRARYAEEKAASQPAGVRLITTMEEYRARRWSWQAMAEGDLSRHEPVFARLEEMRAALPQGMKILAQTADIFTFAWELMGFTEFCLATYEAPELIETLMSSIAAAQTNSFREVLRRGGDSIGAIMYSDDIAYTEGLMLAPEFFREFLFKHMKQLIDLGASHGLPFIYHSDGRLYQVFDDLAALGVRAIQPLEPKSMDPLEIKRRWPGKFCLLGNIDLDLMARGSIEAVERHVRERVQTLNVGGGYMPGVSNTVPYYVNRANWVRMIETVYSFES